MAKTYVVKTPLYAMGKTHGVGGASFPLEKWKRRWGIRNCVVEAKNRHLESKSAGYDGAVTPYLEMVAVNDKFPVSDAKRNCPSFPYWSYW